MLGYDSCVNMASFPQCVCAHVYIGPQIANILLYSTMIAKMYGRFSGVRQRMFSCMHETSERHLAVATGLGYDA